MHGETDRCCISPDYSSVRSTTFTKAKPKKAFIPSPLNMLVYTKGFEIIPLSTLWHLDLKSDELEFIDWENDSDSTNKCDGSEKDDSLLEISDSDSCTNINSLPVREENDELCKVFGIEHVLRSVMKYETNYRTLSLVMRIADLGKGTAVKIEPYRLSLDSMMSEAFSRPIDSVIYPQATSTEISEYSSDNDSVGEGETSLATPTPGSTKRLQPRSGADTGDATARPASKWLRSAQALLRTPGKQAGKASRGPSESAKKRKLLRGGLAERLCRLQNRERSAISFWRHQCISDAKIPSDKSGVLIVKILEIFEECTIQVAICQQLEESPATLSPEDAVISAEEPILKVLFTRETAAHLKSRPQDVIHIYPPWSLQFPDFGGLLLRKEWNPIRFTGYPEIALSTSSA
ncbi:hypothetical protein BTVI_90153 [Pitangus sulphuratus]|nr:hypothetical protein BTVI_90153 [Pitangus sulphuratus]